MSVILSRLKYPLYYPTQVNPKKSGTTKGGYLEGNILLPECWKPGINLKLKLFCVPHEHLYWDNKSTGQLNLERKFLENEETMEDIHPCLLHLVYMKGGRRNSKDEPEPSFNNWIKELIIEGVIVKDLATNKQIAKVEMDADEKTWMIGLGKGGNNLNINLLLPKTKAKHLGGGIVEEEEMKCVIRKMLVNKAGLESSLVARKTEILNRYFHENNSINLNRLKIKVEFLSDDFFYSALSAEIQSQGHTKTASIKFETPNILKCCTNGGRTVVMESKCSLSKDIKPKLVSYKKDPDGQIVPDPETQAMVRQPDSNKIIFSKINNSIRFEAPAQEERIIQPSSVLRLVAVWSIDGEEQTANEFKFQYLKHPWPRGGTCVFCELDVDGGKEEDCSEENIDSMSPHIQTTEDNPMIYHEDVNIPIEELIDFTDDTASSSSDSFAVAGIDSEYICQESSFSNVRLQSRNLSSESSSSSDSFVILNSPNSSAVSDQRDSAVQILPIFTDLQTPDGFSVVESLSLTTVHIASATPAGAEPANYQVSCYQQQARSAEHDSRMDFDFLNSLHLFGNLNLYSIGEILMRKDVAYYDPDHEGLFSKTIVHLVSQERDLSFVDVLSFPHFDRTTNRIEHRCFSDYFHPRECSPSILVLHRFGGATIDTIHQYLAEVPGEEYGNSTLSKALNNVLSKGLSTNYVALHNMSRTLIIRMGDPARYAPQSVAKYNHVSVTALVQTNDDQEFPMDAFDKLLDVVRNDLEDVRMSPPTLLVSHQEIRGSWQEGWIANIHQLRRNSGMRKPSYEDLQASLQ